jgi:hypothetical protein
MTESVVVPVTELVGLVVAVVVLLWVLLVVVVAGIGVGESRL